MPDVEKKVTLALLLEPNDVFEMFGNLYQVDLSAKIGDATQVHAHIIATVDRDKPKDGDVIIFLDPYTVVSIED